MIAHIRPPKQPESTAPIVRARHMVAETLLPDKPGPRRRAVARKLLLLGGLLLLAVAAAVAYYAW
jgi:hypothetical protein